LGRGSQSSSGNTVDDVEIDLGLRVGRSGQDGKVVGINELEDDFAFFGDDFSEVTFFTVIIPAGNFIDFLLKH
jgi:hypothetical protein